MLDRPRGGANAQSVTLAVHVPLALLQAGCVEIAGLNQSQNRVWVAKDARAWPAHAGCLLIIIVFPLFIIVSILSVFYHIRGIFIGFFLSKR